MADTTGVQGLEDGVHGKEITIVSGCSMGWTQRVGFRGQVEPASAGPAKEFVKFKL